MFTIEYDRFMCVKTTNAARARLFFGLPDDWPAYPDANLPGHWNVLSPKWQEQQRQRDEIKRTGQ